MKKKSIPKLPAKFHRNYAANFPQIDLNQSLVYGNITFSKSVLDNFYLTLFDEGVGAPDIISMKRISKKY